MAMIPARYDPAPSQWGRFTLMGFPALLVAARHARKMSQAQLARMTGINPSQLKRYELGANQPSIEVLRKLAIALNVSTDALLFEEGERGPDDELRLAFEALTSFPSDDKAMVTRFIQGLIIQNQAKLWSKAS